MGDELKKKQEVQKKVAAVLSIKASNVSLSGLEKLFLG